MNRRKYDTPKELRLALTTDQRTAENLLLEIRAVAQRCGIEASDIQVVVSPRVGPKNAKRTARSKSKP